MPTIADFLAQIVALNIAVIGDSNVVVPAEQMVLASQLYSATPAPVVNLAFPATLPTIGLREIAELEVRLASVDLDQYDAFVINLGQNDLHFENANWIAYFGGTYPSGGGMHFYERVRAVLDALPPNTPIYWLSVPQGLPTSPYHPWEIAAVDCTLIGFQDPTIFPAFAAPSGQPDSRFRYVDIDALIGPATPKFDASAVHLSPGAAGALWSALVRRLIDDLT